MAKATISQYELSIINNEIKMAETLNEQELFPIMQEAILRYTGKFVPDIATAWTILLNEVYPIVQFNLPSIFFRNPRVFLKPKNKYYMVKKFNPRTQEKEDVQVDSTKSARTQEAILNYVIGEIKYKQEVRKVAMDANIFPHGVLWHGYKGDFGMTEEDSFYIKNDNVFVKRLNPLRFLKDPSVTLSDLDEARWVARSTDVRLQDLLEDDSLDIDKKSLKGEHGYGDKVGTKDFKELKSSGQDARALKSLKPLLDVTDKEFQDSMGSKFVKVYEVFVRPTKAEKRQGIKGKVLLLTPEQKKPLRIDWWTYKAEGFPAKILELNPVPDSQIGLADYQIYGSIADHKNLVINQQIRNAENLNKVIFGISKENTTEEQITKIRNGENNIVEFESGNIAQQMSVINASGGSSNELYLLDQRIDKNLQDKSGVSDLKKGFLQSGEESATSVKLRNAGSSARPAYRQDLMADFLKESIHFIKQLLQQFMPIKEAVRITGTLDVEWSENPSKEELQADTDVDIDVISMLPEDPTRELQETKQVLDLATQAIANPQVMAKLQQEGSTFNLTPLIDSLLNRLKIRDPEVFRRIRQEESEGFASISELRQAQANVQAALAGQPPPSPPQQGQDHRTRLEVYSSINNLLNQMGQQAELLEQLIELQAQLLSDLEAKESPRTPQSVRLSQKGSGVSGAGNEKISEGTRIG